MSVRKFCVTFSMNKEGSDMNECIDCGGAGEVEVDYAMPQSNSRDVGSIETRIEECDWCNGTGEIEEDE